MTTAWQGGKVADRSDEGGDLELSMMKQKTVFSSPSP